MSESLGIGRARQWLEEDPNRVYGSILPLSRDKAGGGLRLALPTAARDLGRGVLDMLEGHMTPEASMALLDVPTGGLMRAAAIGARVPATQLGIFAGVGAKTANKAALETAQHMAREGADPRAIWRDTGWFQGPEGKWRWEIDDSRSIPTMSANRIAREQELSRLYAGRAFKHDDLYEAYPELRTAGVRYERGAPGASWSRDEQMVRLRGPALKDTQMPSGSTMLHEMQHAVQDTEGFARGASPRQFPEPDVDVINWEGISPVLYKYKIDGAELGESALSALDRMRREILDNPNASFSDIASIDRERKRISGMPSVYSQYQKTAGEAEARAVQKRMDMTPEQRRATFPLDSYDVPLDELIVRGAEVDPEFRRLWLQGNAT